MMRTKMDEKSLIRNNHLKINSYCFSVLVLIASVYAIWRLDLIVREGTTGEERIEAVILMVNASFALVMGTLILGVALANRYLDLFLRYFVHLTMVDTLGLLFMAYAHPRVSEALIAGEAVAFLSTHAVHVFWFVMIILYTFYILEYLEAGHKEQMMYLAEVGACLLVGALILSITMLITPVNLEHTKMITISLLIPTSISTNLILSYRRKFRNHQAIFYGLYNVILMIMLLLDAFTYRNGSIYLCTSFMLIFLYFTLQVQHDHDRRKTQERDTEIISALTSDYTSVYFVDPDSEALTTYSMNDDTETTFGSAFRNGISYTEAYRMYVESFVYEDDKKRMLEFGSMNRLKRELADKKSLSATFRSNAENGLHYCEIKYVKVNGEREQLTGIALGFADRDREIVEHYVNDQLLGEYDAVYMIDLDHGTTRSVLMPRNLNPADFEEVPFTEAMHKYGALLDADYREAWMELSNPQKVKEYLAETDRREYVYKIPGIERKWHRCIFQVLERRNRVPAVIIMCFMGMDDSQAQKMELSRKIEDQNRVLEQQREQLEQALRQANAANSAKSVFLSNMSHDIRTPMNAILGFAQLALQNAGDNVDMKSYLNKILISGDHLLALIGDILDMSRIEAGSDTLKEEPCNLRQLLQDQLMVFEASAQKRGQKLTLDLDGLQNANVWCDSSHYDRILMNLIGNAIKFTPEGGAVTVRLLQKEIPLKGYAGYELHVLDTGIGMSEEFQKHIFEIFTRERNTINSETEGTGLGMAITRKYVDMMGGSIEVHSKEGEGSEFIVRIPFRLQKQEEMRLKEQQKKEAEKQQVELAGKSVLLVEDNLMNLEIAQEILSDWGMAVETAENGMRAVDFIRMRRPGFYDLILMDIQMPIMNGYEATREIRRMNQPGKSDIPIIAMTANAFEEDRKTALEAGMNAHVAKPIDLARLRSVLEQQIAGRT